MNTTAKSEVVRPQSTEFSVAKQAPNFDHLARIYRWMELLSFGALLSRCRNTFLPELGAARRALVLGDGDGRFTAELLRVNPRVRIDAVDASPAMLDALLSRAKANSCRVSVYCEDAREWQPANGKYDLVVTHFFLDCLTTKECTALAASLRGAVSPAGFWIVSEFAVPEGWFGRLVARPLIWLLYRAFGALTGLTIRSLPDYQIALRGAGFSLARQRTRLCGLLVSEMWRNTT
jgi:SAM-dependent methyltransferase